MAGHNGSSKRYHSNRRKDRPGAFPWTSKEEKAYLSRDLSKFYQSEYTACYKPWPNKTSKSTRPVHKPAGGQPFSSKTSYNQVYVKNPITQKEASVKDPHVKPTTHIGPNTVYTHAYPKYSTVQRNNCTVKSAKPDHKFSKPTITFKGNSIYKTSYPRYDPEIARISRAKAVRPSENLHTPVHCKGDVVTSTFKAEFTPPPAIKPPQLVVPKDKNIKLEGAFDKSTVYKETYLPHKVEPIVLAKAPRKTNTNVPFIAITTHMADYVNHGTVARDPCYRPPDHSAIKPDGNFQGESTNSAAYKAWPVQERIIPVWGREKEYKKVPAKLITNSTYSTDYQDPKVCQMATPCRPSHDKDAIIRQNPRFPMQSTYGASFQAWKDARPSELCKIKDNVKCSTNKMDISSTKQSDYKGEQSERMSSCRRQSQHRELNADRKIATFSTTYRDAYRGYQFL